MDAIKKPSLALAVHVSLLSSSSFSFPLSPLPRPLLRRPPHHPRGGSAVGLPAQRHPAAQRHHAGGQVETAAAGQDQRYLAGLRHHRATRDANEQGEEVDGTR